MSALVRKYESVYVTSCIRNIGFREPAPYRTDPSASLIPDSHIFMPTDSAMTCYDAPPRLDWSNKKQLMPSLHLVTGPSRFPPPRPLLSQVLIFDECESYTRPINTCFFPRGCECLRHSRPFPFAPPSLPGTPDRPCRPTASSEAIGHY